MSTNDTPLTLENFNNRIIRPMAIEGIKSGKFDIVLNSARERDKCIQVYSSDLQIIFAIVDRLRVLGYE